MGIIAEPVPVNYYRFFVVFNHPCWIIWFNIFTLLKTKKLLYCVFCVKISLIAGI